MFLSLSENHFDCLGQAHQGFGTTNGANLGPIGNAHVAQRVDGGNVACVEPPLPVHCVFLVLHEQAFGSAFSSIRAVYWKNYGLPDRRRLI